MASIVTETGGRRLIQLSPSEHPKRPKIRLGKVTKREAESVRIHVENLQRAKVIGAAYPPATAEWLAGLPVPLRRRLERFGLIGLQKRRDCPTLADWLEDYVRSRQDVKSGTMTFYGHTRRNLLDFFGSNRRLDDISPGDADEFCIYLTAKQGLAENTVRRRCRMAKQFFRAAMRKRLISENPFAGIKAGDRPNEKRYYFVTTQEAKAILEDCPDAEWRLIFALCRYGGLRCSTEVLRLRWGDVDWENMRFTVHASKTEHHADGGIRQVPIIPELYPYLRDCFEQAKPGTEYVITRYRNTNANLRTQLTRIIKRAGLTPWPKLFQNLRSTRETELTEKFPVHVVCKWIGNSQPVAAKHYLQVTEDHFRKAVQDPVQSASVRDDQGLSTDREKRGEETFVTPGQSDTTHCKNSMLASMGPVGAEHGPNSLDNTLISAQGASKSAAFATENDSQASSDGDFATALPMIATLPLSPAEKAQVVRRLIASKNEKEGRKSRQA